MVVKLLKKPTTYSHRIYELYVHLLAKKGDFANSHKYVAIFAVSGLIY